jgi:hypothetical protein
MEKVGIFYGYLEFINAIWYILWTSGNLVAFWYISSHFGILRREKSGNPGVRYCVTLVALIVYKKMPHHWNYIQSLNCIHSVSFLVESANQLGTIEETKFDHNATIIKAVF